MSISAKSFFLSWNNQMFLNLSQMFWNEHLMVQVVLVQGRRQSDMISVNDWSFIKQGSNRKKLGNIVLKITIYAYKIYFPWLQITPFILRTLLIVLACEVDSKNFCKAS